MTTQAPNEHPLHNHTTPGDLARPWTQDTLSAHLHHLHGVDVLPADAELGDLIAVHDDLDHGTPAKPAAVRRTDGHDMTEAGRVSDWLAGFYESGSRPGPGCLSGEFSGEDQAAITRVRELIGQRLDKQEAEKDV